MGLGFQSQPYLDRVLADDVDGCRWEKVNLVQWMNPHEGKELSFYG